MNVDFAKGKELEKRLYSDSTDVDYLSIKNYVENKINSNNLKQEISLALAVTDVTINEDLNIYKKALKDAGVGGNLDF